MNIDELWAYHPDHPARPTIYEWVGKKAIPVHKDGKKLRFLRSEIDEWLNGGRAKTQAELDREAIEYGIRHQDGQHTLLRESLGQTCWHMTCMKLR